MISSLVNIVNNVALGPQMRQVNRYLDGATQDSVLAELEKTLSSQVYNFQERQALQTAFEKHCVEDPESHEKYWTESSLHRHVRGTHTADAVSDAAVSLLWRSLYFYAHHPFPRDPHPDARLDFSAFRRAALLTAFRCDALLGTRELDYYWRPPAGDGENEETGAFFRRAGLARVFRSVAGPDHALPEVEKLDDSASVADAADVLAMLGPQSPVAVPTVPQLEAVARRLFGEGPAGARRDVVKRDDLAVLMDLLLRLQLSGDRWGVGQHFGTIAPAGSVGASITEALVDRLAGGHGEESIGVTRLCAQMDSMPNLVLRFQQLWAVLIQPSKASEPPAEPQTDDDLGIARIAGAISLFAPYIELDHSGKARPDKQDTHLELIRSAEIPPQARDITVTRLRERLGGADKSAHVVLFSGDTEEDSTDDYHSDTLIGAYLPATASSSPKETHIIFQLMPRFRVLRWAGAKVSRAADLVRSAETTSPPGGENVAGAAEKTGSSGSAYWIGDPQGQSVGLKIDSSTGTATLTNSFLGHYKEIITGGSDSAEAAGDVTIWNALIHVFEVAAPVPVENS